ncbi:hypothetical protein LguiA_024794 [Lonicera macranthoides]
MEIEEEIDENNDSKGNMWVLEQKLDQPMDEEAGRIKNMYREKKFSAVLLLRLAFQSLGVVYGDLGTSPLYVFYNTFPKGIKDPEDVVGALSLIIYSLTLIPLLKYVFIVCRANDSGQGGTFALYSLLCRHAKIKTIPNQHRTDEELTTYSRSTFHEQSFAAKTKRWLEAHAFRKNALLILVLVGTCMVIGDGILTPAISEPSNPGHECSCSACLYPFNYIIIYLNAKYALPVLSASGGIKVNHPKMSNDVVVLVAVVILVGTEALFADLAHFPVPAVQLAFTVVVFPCLLLAYSGQAAYLMKNKEHVVDSFYRSIPGTAVVVVMLATTLLMTLIMLLVWRCHWILVILFTVSSLLVECTYFSAVLFKVDQGGWVPLVIAAAFLLIMYIWHYGTVKRYEFEMHSKVSMAWILGLGPSLGLVRVPGIGLVYTELASGVPHIFSHFITNLPAIHSVVVFVCLKYLPVYMVPEDERFLVKRIGPKSFHMFRCVARYGYKDLHKKDDDFEKKIFENLFLFVRLESMMEGCSDSDEYSLYGQQTQRSRDLLTRENGSQPSDDVEMTMSSVDSIVPAKSPVGSSGNRTEVDEMEFLRGCRDAGVVHILGNTVVRARRDASFHKRIAIDYVYAFLRKICREHTVIFNIPQECLLNVGQIFYV